MKNILLMIIFLCLLLPPPVPADELNIEIPDNTIRTIVIPFKNSTGNPSLDWLSLGLQRALTVDLLYLKGLETLTFADLLSFYTGKNLKKVNRDELLERTKNEHIQQVWFGKYKGDSNEIKVEISIIEVNSGKVLANIDYKAPLQRLLQESSRTVLEISEQLGITANKDEKKRILSLKTKSVDAWRLNAEAFFLMLKAYSENNFSREIIQEWQNKWVEASTIDPDYAETLSYLGFLYGVRGQLEKALGTFEKALNIKPYLIETNLNMGFLLMNLNERDRALEYLIKAVNLNPSLREQYDLILEALVNSGRREEARKLALKLFVSKSSKQSMRLKAGLIIEGIAEKAAALPALVGVLKNTDKAVRQDAATLLGRIGDKTVVPALIEALKDKDRDVRRSAASALGDIGEKSAVPALLESLKDPEVRYTAARALGHIEDKSAVLGLIELLKDHDELLSYNAAESLGRINDKTIVPKLMEMLKSPDKNVRRGAIRGLGIIGNKDAVPALIKMLKDADKDIRYDAAKAFRNISSKTAVPALIEALKDVSGDVRYSTARALGNTEDKAALSALIESTKDSDKRVVYNALNALGVIGDKSAVPLLAEMLKNPEEEIRSNAAYALGKTGDNSAVPALIELLKDPDSNVRLNAAAALGKIGDKAAAPALIEELKDTDKYWRNRVVNALGDIGDKKAVPALIDALQDRDRFVRLDAAIALGKMGNRAGIPIMVKAIEDTYGLLTGGSWTFSKDNAAKTLVELDEVSVLYEGLRKTSAVFLFHQIRKNLLFSDSLHLLINSRDSFLESSAYYLLALKAREEGKYEDQLEYANNALKNIDPKNNTALAILTLWLKTQSELKLDKAHNALESIKKAEKLLGNVSMIEREDYKELFIGHTLFIKGEALTEAGDSKQAVNAYEDALEELERGDKYYISTDAIRKLQAMVRTGLGALQIKTGKENLQKAVEGGRAYRANDSVEMENEEKRYLELARQKVAEGDYEESQKLIEELNLRRTKYFNRRMKLHLADAEKQKEIEKIRKKQKEIERIGRKIDDLAGKSRGKDGDAGGFQQDDNIRQLEAEKNRKRRELKVYLTRLKKSHPDIAALMGAKPMELSAIQEQLPEDTAILQYLILPDKLIVFIIKSDGINIVESRTERNKLKSRVKRLRREIKAIVKGKESNKIKPLSMELNNILLKPVEKAGMLKGIKIIGIAPNSFLHHLPFGALMNKESRYLIDRYDLFFINSTSILGVAMDRRKEKISGENRLLALSNPDGTLEYADMEVSNISKLFKEKQLYSQKEAKKSVIQNIKSDYSVLHLSTHGNFDPIDSTKSHLVMADSNLTVEDIWGLPLKGISLTVLSACETGVGEVLSGDDVVSLENAFIYAGSPSVIATLWKVDDQSTAELMGLFYQNYLKGITGSRSLTDAQRQLKKKYKHPFFWAGFTLRGDWR